MLTFLPSADHFFVGLGARDPNDNTSIIPVATIEALPGQDFLIYPKSIYYICTGTYTKGKIIDYKTLGKRLQLDFGKTNIGKVGYTNNANGDYVPDDENSKKVGKVIN